MTPFRFSPNFVSNFAVIFLKRRKIAGVLRIHACRVAEGTLCCDKYTFVRTTVNELGYFHTKY